MPLVVWLCREYAETEAMLKRSQVVTVKAQREATVAKNKVTVRFLRYFAFLTSRPVACADAEPVRDQDCRSRSAPSCSHQEARHAACHFQFAVRLKFTQLRACQS